MIVVCRQKTGSNQPYVFCISESISTAEITVNVQSSKNPDYTYWVQDVSEDTKIGDDCEYNPIKLKKEKVIDHTSDKTGSPGFHGKYERKTSTNKPSVRSDKYPTYKNGKESYRYIPIVLGFALRNDPPYINDKSNVSYAKITNQTAITDPADRTVKHRAEIKDNRVYLNDHRIATAPAGKTKSQKEKFCKAVVWSLLNDPISLQDKLSEISGIISMPEIILEKPKIVFPVYPTGYIPYLKLTITEEVYA